MIRILDKNVADKIAAGEVIERPVSIVKELVENSIDAGATSVTVEIKNGGKSYIRVTDNGSGIESEQLRTAFLRHATSKITAAADLNSIETLGFRGEALASIAAVTRTEVVTKTGNCSVGRRLIINGGEIIDEHGTGCPDGTSFIVTDLFYNTPARLKFMKSDGAEGSQITDFVSRCALCYDSIKFRYINNGNIVFATNGDGNRLNTILAVYKEQELRDLVPIYYSDEKNTIEGYISTPSISRSTRKSQVFFVNGRAVDSKVIEKAVDRGYKERLFEGRFPVVFLFLRTLPGDLDVNIHPNKREVRFDREDEIIDFVSDAVRTALTQEQAVVNAGSYFLKKESFTAPPLQIKEEQVDIKQILSIKRDELHPDRYSQTQLNIEKPAYVPFDFESLKVTGVIFNTYITATDEHNFYLIDQHAAHERIFYEKLVGQYENEEKYRQPLLTPIITEVAPADAEFAEEWTSALSKMGYTVEEFGNNSYILKEIPTYMDMSEAEDFFHIFVENITETTNMSNITVINKLIMKSCKSAVKAHDILSQEEINALIKDLSSCVNPFSCPHGRPTFIKMTSYDIERMFKRV